MQQIEVITGPTCSGKTVMALLQAAVDPTIEVINADASLLYRGFDIGTAKPSQEIRSRVRHHIVDILEPSEFYSASDYTKLARSIIRTMVLEGKKPLVVGGTGFYIDALFFGLASLEVDENVLQDARLRVEREMKDFGFDMMLKRLEDVDPIMHQQVSREKNPRRLERAWEYFYAADKPLGEARQQKSEPFEFAPSFTLLDLEREDLRIRIANRIDEMLDSGWLKEVESLLGRGIVQGMPAMKAIGYHELTDVIYGVSDVASARLKIINRTRQYAKRQVTWMKRYR